MCILILTIILGEPLKVRPAQSASLMNRVEVLSQLGRREDLLVYARAVERAQQFATRKQDYDAMSELLAKLTTIRQESIQRIRSETGLLAAIEVASAQLCAQYARDEFDDKTFRWLTLEQLNDYFGPLVPVPYTLELRATESFLDILVYGGGQTLCLVVAPAGIKIWCEEGDGPLVPSGSQTGCHLLE